jgi:hypothetical protein
MFDILLYAKQGQLFNERASYRRSRGFALLERSMGHFRLQMAGWQVLFVQSRVMQRPMCLNLASDERCSFTSVAATYSHCAAVCSSSSACLLQTHIS